MINVDVPFEIRQIIGIARYIDPAVASWLEERNQAMAVYAQRPDVTLPDAVVVAARRAWSLYVDCHAYVCQSGRAFRDVERIAFYADREVKQDIPRITHRRDNVEWTVEEINRLRGSEDRTDRKIATVIERSRALGWSDGRYQVFLLTRSGDATHRELEAALPHHAAGRGSAFTQGQRYMFLHLLETAKTTADLEPSRPTGV